MGSWLALMAIFVLPAGEPVTHDAGFWREIARNDYAVPAGESPAALIAELSQLLGSTDPEKRDTFAYGIPVRWIYRQRLLDEAELRGFLASWTANLDVRIGEAGTDSVLLRSFSALNLSILAAVDNEDPFLDGKGFRELLDEALSYLDDEKDVRGFVPGKGWYHSAAHTADLLKFLGRSRHLTLEQQGLILEGIARKLRCGTVFTWGEDERLARAVLSILTREDLDRNRFQEWLGGIAAEAEGLWDGDLDPRRFMTVQNGRNLLRSLFVILSKADDSPTVRWTREAVLETLGKL